MFEWLTANIGSVIVGLVVLCVVAAVAFKLIRDKKRGKGSCSCGDNCGSCACSGACHGGEAAKQGGARSAAQSPLSKKAGPS